MHITLYFYWWCSSLFLLLLLLFPISRLLFPRHTKKKTSKYMIVFVQKFTLRLPFYCYYFYILSFFKHILSCLIILWSYSFDWRNFPPDSIPLILILFKSKRGVRAVVNKIRDVTLPVSQVIIQSNFYFISIPMCVKM